MHNGTEYATGCRGRTEIEAESVAYILCQAAGLTTAAYSFGYVAHWSGGGPNQIKTTAEGVITTAEGVITTARSILEATGLLSGPGSGGGCRMTQLGSAAGTPAADH